MALNITETVVSPDGNGSAEDEHKAPQNQTTRHNKTNVTLTLELGHSHRGNNSNDSMLEFAVRGS